MVQIDIDQIIAEAQNFSNMNGSNGKAPQQSSQPLHQGKWTPEEEEYVECLIGEFKSGLLPLAEGTSLRTFLSKMLNCDPMRISKKFVGSNYNGKQLYTRRPNTLPPDEVIRRRTKLCELEKKFLKRVQPLSNAMEPTDLGRRNDQLSQLPATGAGNDGGLGGLVADTAFLGGGANDNISLPFTGNGRINRRAAAAGRALLGESSGLKSQGQDTSLANASSMEIVAELQRRTNADTLARQASCSSLDLDAAVELQRQRSTDNLLKQTLSQNFSSNGLFDPALERALTSLASTSDQTAASLSNFVGRQASLQSLSSIGALLNAGDISNNSAEGGRNWSAASSAIGRSSAGNLTDLMMQLSKTKSSSLSQRREASWPGARGDIGASAGTTNINLAHLSNSGRFNINAGLDVLHGNDDEKITSSNMSGSNAEALANAMNLSKAGSSDALMKLLGSKNKSGNSFDGLSNNASFDIGGSSDSATAFANLMKFSKLKSKSRVDNMASIDLNGLNQSFNSLHQQQQLQLQQPDPLSTLESDSAVANYLMQQQKLSQFDSNNDFQSMLNRKNKLSQSSREDLSALMGLCQQEDSAGGQGSMLLMEQQMRQLMDRQKSSDQKMSTNVSIENLSTDGIINENHTMDNLSMSQMRQLLEGKQSSNAQNQNKKRSHCVDDDFDDEASFNDNEDSGPLKKLRGIETILS